MPMRQASSAESSAVQRPGQRPARRYIHGIGGGAVLAVALLVLVTRASASQGGESADWKTIEVTATSFTLAEDETKRSNVGVTASGVKVKPSSKAIAVSRDLLHEGLDYGTKVRIKDLPGTYTVRDTMHRRWHDKIDILFAKKKRALEWGRKDIEIQYHVSDSQ